MLRGMHAMELTSTAEPGEQGSCSSAPCYEGVVWGCDEGVYGGPLWMHL